MREERLGWNRTVALAIGAFVGVIATAYLLHLQGKKR